MFMTRFKASLGDEGTQSCPQFLHFQCSDELVGQAAESKFKSSSSLCLSSGNYSRRLFQKTIEGFECKVNGKALLDTLLHNLGWLDGQAQNTRHFQVSGSGSWKRQACLRKTCYHSCDTDLVRESKRF